MQHATELDEIGQRAFLLQAEGVGTALVAQGVVARRYHQGGRQAGQRLRPQRRHPPVAARALVGRVVVEEPFHGDGIQAVAVLVTAIGIGPRDCIGHRIDEQLKAELDRLRTDKRREIAERIAAAREFGEIAENAEYDDAKNEQMMLEHRISQLEERLANAQVIDKKRVDTSVVSVGAVVRLRDVNAKETVEYFIVGSAEANPAERKLSNESPVGKAILGRKKGETVEVVTPRGSKVKFKIMEIKAA